MRRARLLLSVVVLGAGCGGRTGLGEVPATPSSSDAAGSDATQPVDAPAGDGLVADGASDRDGGGLDGPRGRDASAGRNCAEMMLCAFQAGSDYQAMLACLQGGSTAGMLQAGDVVVCLVSNCYQYLMADGGGQLALFACLVGSCTTQLCMCEGLVDQLPIPILNCPP
jgi:hypothetical protein